MLKRAGRFAVVFVVCFNGAIKIATPQIANRRHLHILFVFQAPDDAVELASTIADADMAKRDSIVGPTIRA